MFRQRDNRLRKGILVLAGLGLAVLTPLAAQAQGVPDVSLKEIAAWLLQKDESTATQTAEIEENARRAEIIAQQDEQLAALDSTLAMLTGTSAFVPELEAGGGAGDLYAASTVYAIDDNNPYIDRIMGDAPVTIEQMIAETAVKFGNHPALVSTAE